MDRLRAGVAGVGHLGYHHARNLAAMPDIELVGVADINEQRAKEVADQLGVKALGDYKELAPDIDIASVAVPTSKHFEVAEFFLERKKHVLLEKPISVTLEEADKLIHISEQNEVILQIGHSERFNSAVETLSKRLDKPVFIESHRLAPFTIRGCDVDVVLDLMIHDLDVILSLLRSPVKRIIDAVGVPLISDYEDIANARLEFENGCVANITASRISAEPLRKIRVFQPYTYFSLDYAAQQIQCYRLKEGPLNLEKPEALVFDQIPIERDEPLRRQLAAFAESVRDGRPPAVSAQDGREALKLAIGIVEFARSKKYE